MTTNTHTEKTTSVAEEAIKKIVSNQRKDSFEFCGDVDLANIGSAKTGDNRAIDNCFAGLRAKRLERETRQANLMHWVNARDLSQILYCLRGGADPHIASIDTFNGMKISAIELAKRLRANRVLRLLETYKK